MVLEEFLNIFLYLFIMFLLNGIQTSTDRIFRLAVPALLAASSHKFMNIIYNEHIGTKLRQNASFVRLDVQLVYIICNSFPAIPQLFQKTCRQSHRYSMISGIQQYGKRWNQMHQVYSTIPQRFNDLSDAKHEYKMHLRDTSFLQVGIFYLSIYKEQLQKSST